MGRPHLITAAIADVSPPGLGIAPQVVEGAAKYMPGDAAVVAGILGVETELAGVERGVGHQQVVHPAPLYAAVDPQLRGHTVRAEQIDRAAPQVERIAAERAAQAQPSAPAIARVK